jgi:sec-independent protein translocase protein TatC
MSGAEQPSPLIQHLLELRRRLMVGALAFIAVWVVLLYWSNDLFTLAARPLLEALPPGTQMVATGVATTFTVPIKLAGVAALFLAFPILLMQLWGFIAPGLYAQERRMLLPLLVSSVLLFYAGVAFAYFGVFPAVFRYFVATAPPGVTVMTDIGAYLDFALVMFFAFGLAFEVPVATVLLVWAGVTTPAGLGRARARGAGA